MWRYITGFLLVMFIGSVPAGNNSTDNWKLVSSEDASWIKTVSSEQHELLFSYHENEAQFFLVLKTANLSPGKTLSASIRIDRGPEQLVKLGFVEKRPDESIVRIELDDAENNTYLSQMINGLTMSIYFDFATAKNMTIPEKISFSLKGFTVALNDLFIVNDIGSLDPAWLLQHKKDRELYCLMTTDISIEVMQYRLKDESYNNVLHLIPKTGYTIIDHNLGEIIEQVYKIPRKDLAYVPRAEKYLMFSNCMAQPFQQTDT